MIVVAAVVGVEVGEVLVTVVVAGPRPNLLTTPAPPHRDAEYKARAPEITKMSSLLGAPSPATCG